MEPTEVGALEWAASGCGDTYTAGQKRHYYYGSGRSANVQNPRTGSLGQLTPGPNPFKVRERK